MKEIITKYNVIWIDDEFDKMSQFILDCKLNHQVNLVPFRFQEAGMDELEKNLSKWDAVILDAKMFDKSDNEIAKLTGLHHAINRLNQLVSRKKVPYFILTGQADLLSNENFKDMVGSFYTKGRDEELLIENLKKEVDKQPERQIINTYQDTFEAVERMHMDDEVKSTLISILKSLHSPSENVTFKATTYYNQLRHVLEHLFRTYHKIGIIPDSCLPNNVVNLNQCSLFLAGKNAEVAKVRFGEENDRVIPTYIEAIIRSILELGNLHSHTIDTTDLDESNMKKMENFFATVNSKYIIFGITLQLCEVIRWSSAYIKLHSNIELNKSKCRKITPELCPQKFEGKTFIPQQDKNGIWHCEECMVGLKTWEGGSIKLFDIENNNNPKTMECYPFWAKFKILR